MTRAQSKARKFTEQELATAKETAVSSRWDFKKFARSGGVEFLLEQARTREQATSAELAWDAIIRNVHPDGAVGAFTIPPRGVKLLPLLASRLTIMRQMCSIMIANSKDPLYLVGIGPDGPFSPSLPHFILGFHVVAMTEKSVRSFYKCFRAKELEHFRSSLPRRKDRYGILAIFPLSAPDDQRDLQFVHKLVQTFEACYGKPLPQFWSHDIVRFTSSDHADKAHRRDLMSGIGYDMFTKDLPEVTLSVSAVCFLSPFSNDASTASSTASSTQGNSNVASLEVMDNQQFAREHPVRIHQDLIGRLLVGPISNKSAAAGNQIGLLVYHPDHQTPPDSTNKDSYAWLQAFYIGRDPGVATEFPSTPHVTQLLRMVPAEVEQVAVKQKLQMLASRGWLLGGVVVVCSQENNAGAPLTDVINLFASQPFVQHVRPMVRLPNVSVASILLHPSTPDPANVHLLPISSCVVPSTWLLSAEHRSVEDWSQCRTDREPWYSVAPLEEEHADFSEIEAAASQASEGSATLA